MDWRLFCGLWEQIFAVRYDRNFCWELIFAFLCSSSRAYLALADRFLSVHAEKLSNHQVRMEKMWHLRHPSKWCSFR